VAGAEPTFSRGASSLARSLAVATSSLPLPLLPPSKPRRVGALNEAPSQGEPKAAAPRTLDVRLVFEQVDVAAAPADQAPQQIELTAKNRRESNCGRSQNTRRPDDYRVMKSTIGDHKASLRRRAALKTSTLKFTALAAAVMLCGTSD